MNVRHFSSGFTLMELIVSVTLVLVMSGLMIAGYNGFNSEQTVIQAAQTLKVNLARIRSQASSGLKPADLNNPSETCEQLIGYQVDFPSNTTYTARALCVVAGDEQLFGPVQTMTLPTGVQFVPVPDTTIFYALNRGVSLPETITLTNSIKTVTIEIVASGNVSDYETP